MNSINENIQDVIDLIKDTDINGCITGSSMTGADFSTWKSAPDVDVFVYSKPQLLYAAHLLTMKFGFKPLNGGEEWKLGRLNNFETRKKAPVETLKFINDKDVIVNVSWKDGKNNIFAVLASFDMSIIMMGYDIKKKVMLDLRCAWSGMVPEDPEGRWSKDVKVAVPNPLRDQDVDMYGTEMWVRQFDRVIKYWDRGYDTRPMARFYIKLIDGVIEKGQLFSTQKSEDAYNGFVEIYEPLKEKMVTWLEDKEEC